MKVWIWLGLVIVAGAVFGVPVEPAFRDVAEAVGLDFHHFTGMNGKLYFAEHMGGAVALFDFDNDGDLDVYLGQGHVLDDTPPEETVFPPHHPLPLGDRLYRNDLEVGEDGKAVLRFTDVTEASGLKAYGYSQGVAVADYDKDGFVDLYITNLVSNQLWRNRGDQTFEEVTAKTGTDDRRWSLPAVFFDYDGDSHLDLYVGNYVEFGVATHKYCASPTGVHDYCGPRAYPPAPNRLLHNRGDGTFEDVSEQSGILGAPGNTLGLVAADLNGDGLTDLYVANDQMENEMLINQGDGTFIDDALLSGTAVDAMGQPQASMGVVAADLNGDGFVDLFMTHLFREMNTVYLNDGQGLFNDATRTSGLGRASWNSTGFGTAPMDYDGDGILDLYVANGAVQRVEAQMREGEPHPLRETNLLFRGLGGARFEEVPAEAREDPIYSDVSRGMAMGDLDNDGDPDLVIVNNAGPVRLLLILRQRTDDWVGLRLVNGDGKRYLLGTRVGLRAADGSTRWQWVHTDGSYAAANDPRVLYALRPGEAKEGEKDQRVARFHVIWPDGLEEEFSTVPVGGYTTLRQGSGEPLKKDSGEPEP